MANDSKDIELRIRARDYSQKTLDEVTKSLSEMAAAQKAQLDAAAKGTTTAAALEKSYRQIEDALKAVGKQFAATQQFDQQTAALERLRNAADKARTTQTEYANSLAGLDKVTKEQANQQTKLASAVRKADKDVRLAENALARTVTKLDGYGIATDKVAQAQQTLKQSFDSGNAALERQAKAIDEIAGNIQRKIAADQEAAAAAKKAAAEQVAADKAVADAAAQAADWQRRMLLLQNQRDKAASDQAAAEKAVSNALRMSAQQAEASAKGYQTLARSVKSVRGDELAQQLRAINDPAGVAVENLKGLEDTLTSLEAKVNSIKGPVKDFRQTLASLSSAQQGAAGIAAQIDAYRRQVDVLRATRAEYSAARAAVLDLASQMRAGGGNAAELNRQMSAAQATLARTASSMSAQVSKTRELRQSLRDAGVDTNNLAEAQGKLVTSANRATDTINKLRQAYQKFNVEGQKPFSLFGSDGGRTTLSYGQRIRGELLAMTTAYVGLQATVGLAGGAIDAYMKKQQILSTLTAAFSGDVAKARAEMEYLRATTDRIGVSFADSAQGYSSLTIAAKSAGLGLNESRFIFEQFAKAGVVAGQSNEQFARTLKAVQDILSKGTIQAEELTGQIGDNLAGAFSIAARGADATGKQFRKMMEGGEITSDYLINIARELGKTYSGADKAAESTRAAAAKFETAAFFFKAAIAENGFADAYTQFLVKLTELMKGEDGKRLAAAIGDAFTAIVKILQWVAENIDLVKAALSVLTGLAVAKWAFGVATAFGNFFTILKKVFDLVKGGAALGSIGTALGGVAGAAGGATTAVGLFRLALLGLRVAFPILTAIATGAWAAYEAWKAFNGEKDKGSKPVKPEGSWDEPSKGGASGSWGDTPDPGTGGTAESRAIKAMDKEADARQKKLDEDRKAAQKKSAKESLAERQKLIRDEYALYRQAAENEIKNVEELSKAKARIDAQEKQALLTDKIRFDAENAKSNAAAGAREVSLKEQIKDQLLKIQNDLQAKEVDLDKNSSFEDRKRTRIEAVASAYDKLKRSITQLGKINKADAAQASADLDKYIKQLQTIEGINATTAEIKRLQDELNDAESIQNAQLKEQQALLEAELITQEKFLANAAAINTSGDNAIKTAATNLQAFVDAAVKANAGIMSLTGQAEVKARTTGAIAGASNTQNKNAELQFKAEEQAIQNLVDKRTAAEAIFKQQVDLRMIGEDEYVAKVNANSDIYKKQIVDLTNAMIVQLEARKAQMLLDGTGNAQIIAALDAQIAKMTLLRDATANAAQQFTFMQRQVGAAINSGLDQGLTAAADALTELAKGTMSVGEAFESLGKTTAMIFAQLLMDIAKAIIKQQILNIIASMGPYGQAAAAIAGNVRHSGGVIGQPGGRTRGVSASIFANAPRYHSGGLPGLKSDEVPAILQKGEEVLSKNDERNALNGGLNPAAGAGQNPAGTRFVLVDDRASVAEAMQSAEGETVIVQHIKRNAATIKQLLK